MVDSSGLCLPRLEAHRNLTETVYEALKSAIVENRLPSGHRLTEVAVASTFGVSTTPVREALTRLEREGLVSLIPRRGAVVRSFAAEDILGIYEIREMLEATATVKAIARRSPSLVEQLGDIVARCGPVVAALDQRGFNRLDVEFHRLIMQACGNPHLLRLYERLHDQFQMIRLRAVFLPGRPETPHAEHQQFLAAFAAGDANAAEQLIRWHIQHTALDLVSALSGEEPAQTPLRFAMLEGGSDR